MRIPLIAGNWKMHKTAAEAAAFGEQLVQALAGERSAEALVCPPFTALHALGAAIAGSPIALGAQNVHEAYEGAHTGEISASMLKEAGCRYVIIGHSERRQAGETDAQVNAKVLAASGANLRPILCVGEHLADRQANRTEAVVTGQVRAALADVPAPAVESAVIAYEPVWAIGTGETATPEEANRVAALIRATVSELYGDEAAQRVRIQYGGSVNADNIGTFMQQTDIDGALVGGAGLQVESFVQIVRRTEAARA